MCGIFGIINYGSKRYLSEIDHIKEMIERLLTIVEIRGTDASGICIVSGKKAKVFKEHIPGSCLPKEEGYKDIMKSITYQENFQFMIGHVRARTKGSELFNVNNHPIISGKVIGVHNGVISNDEDIFKVEKDLNRRGEVDSEVIFSLLNKAISIDKSTIISAVQRTSQALVGSYSCAFLHLDHPNYLTLFSGNYANIVLHDFRNYKLMVFGSTDDVITKAGKDISLFHEPSSKREMGKNMAWRINTNNGKIYTFQLNKKSVTQNYSRFPLV